MIETIAQWMEATGVGVAVREGQWWFPVLCLTHLIGMATAAGTIIFMDLRLLGYGIRRAPVSKMAASVLPFTWAGFTILLTSGSLLVFSEASNLIVNRAARIKLVLLVVAGLNVAVFHFGIYRRVAEWDLETRLPLRARIAGCVSIVCWAGIIAAGRAIPYVQ